MVENGVPKRLDVTTDPRPAFFSHGVSTVPST